jgi:hypothetical protein
MFLGAGLLDFGLGWFWRKGERVCCSLIVTAVAGILGLLLDAGTGFFDFNPEWLWREGELGRFGVSEVHVDWRRVLYH